MRTWSEMEKVLDEAVFTKNEASSVNAALALYEQDGQIHLDCFTTKLLEKGNSHTSEGWEEFFHTVEEYQDFFDYALDHMLDCDHCLEEFQMAKLHVETREELYANQRAVVQQIKDFLSL